jgi:hypothetical protein
MTLERSTDDDQDEPTSTIVIDGQEILGPSREATIVGWYLANNEPGQA